MMKKYPSGGVIEAHFSRHCQTPGFQTLSDSRVPDTVRLQAGPDKSATGAKMTDGHKNE